MDDSEDNSASLLDCLFEIDEFLEDSQLSIDDHDTSLTPREREEKGKVIIDCKHTCNNYLIYINYCYVCRATIFPLLREEEHR